MSLFNCPSLYGKIFHGNKKCFHILKLRIFCLKITLHLAKIWKKDQEKLMVWKFILTGNILFLKKMITEVDKNKNIKYFPLLASRYSASNWLQTGIRGHPKTIRPFEQKTQDEIMTRILGMPSGRKRHCCTCWKQRCTCCRLSRTGCEGSHGFVVDTDSITLPCQASTMGCYWCMFLKLTIVFQSDIIKLMRCGSSI